MLLRELFEAPEVKVHQLFAGQNLDAEVRIAAQAGAIDVVIETPAEAPAEAKDGE